MVTFRLIEEDEQRIVYWYFPEGKEDKGHGIIIVDKIQEEIVGLNAQIVSGKAAITRMNMNKAAYEQKQNES